MLIIEDEPLIALDLEDLLAREGATSFAFAASEDEAFGAAQMIRPDIITADVSLVQGTGSAAVRTIRAEFGEIPVVYISATARGCCTEDHRTRVLFKPMNRPAVASAFRELHQLSLA